MTSTDTVPLLELRGDAYARGFAHGRALAERIGRMIEVYGRYFARSEAAVFGVARHFQHVIAEFSREYAEEIEAVAEGAGVDPLWIFALNARSEFLSSMPAAECTALHFGGTPFLGQNWDWERSLEDLIVLARVTRPDGHRFLMMTEPGIIGKIGLNSAGIGVCFNFLPVAKPTNGVPVHVLLRAVLDSTSLAAARGAIERAGHGRSANVLVADRDGQRFDFEFAGDERFELPDNDEVLAHTNHYLGRDIVVLRELYENSSIRLARAAQLGRAHSQRSSEAMRSMLSDRDDPANSICQSYRPQMLLGDIGTVCSIVFDLAAGVMHFRRGNAPHAPFQIYRIDEN
ncbi:MAG: peptidase C45 [Deltaproteobacteria bacterium]|nr:peptidase C45 [Deltaproteobacteria bacterium]